MAIKDGNYKKATRCTGKAKSTGEQCRNAAKPGKDKCRIHGGATPIKHGLYSKYPDAVAGEHMDAAKRLTALASLQKTVPVLVAIMSLWVEKDIVFAPSNYLATCSLMGKITDAVETYEKLTNPELRTGRLQITHDFKDKSDEDLVNETQELIAEAETVCREAAARGEA